MELIESMANRLLVSPKTRLLALWLIVALSLWLNLANNDFPLGFHADETSKVNAILDNTQSFRHPLMLIQIPRAINFVAGITDRQGIVELGRAINGVAGALIVIASYLLFRTMAGEGLALISALGVAVSPIMVVHAHYLKEDIMVTCALILSLFALIRFIESSGAWRWTVALGAVTGCAFSSHYKSVLLVGIYIAAPLIARRQTGWWYPGRVAVAMALAIAVFMGVNYPALQNPDKFRSGFGYEFKHASNGHADVKVRPSSTFYAFHFTRSLIPGLTGLVAGLGLAGLVRIMIGWRTADWRLMILLLYAGLYYFGPEHSPLKPFPGFMRYMVPVAPAMVFGGMKLLADTYALTPGRRLRAVIAAVIVLALALPLMRSAKLDYYMTRDTRMEADRRVEERGIKAKFEAYSSARTMDTSRIISLELDKERASGVTHLVTSSLMYDRYELGASLPRQDGKVYEAWRKYEAIFSHPYEEIRPAYMSFAFSNPVIRIVDIRDAR